MYLPSDAKYIICDNADFAYTHMPHSLEELNSLIEWLSEFRNDLSQSDGFNEWHDSRLKFVKDHYKNEEREMQGRSLPPSLKKGFVYLMNNPDSGLFKIGFSKKPHARLVSLRSFAPKIRLLGYLPGTMQTEGSMHHKFRAKHVRNEWFALSQEDVAIISSKFTYTTP